jgi:hypothetical protein
MKRLILCSGVAVSLGLLVACSGDPTGSLRSGVEKLNPTPSQMFLQQGKTGTVVVSATDGQGNQVETAFALKDIGPGITVERDPTFRPVFVNDSQLAPPATDAMFRFRVTANGLVSSTFTVTADGKDVVVPVNVTPDPLLIPQAAVSSSGPNPQDTMSLTLPAPYAFQGAASVAFGDTVAGRAIVVGRSADGMTLKLLALPGSTGVGAIKGIFINYLPTVPLRTTTDTLAPVTVSTTVTAIPGTSSAATAPVITMPAAGEQTGFIDTGALAAASCGQNTGAPCALYKFSLADSTAMQVRLQGANAADLGLYFINAADGSDADQACDGLGRDDVPEECELTFGAGDYLMAVVSFGPFYTPAQGGPDPNPAWVAVQIGVQ